MRRLIYNILILVCASAIIFSAGAVLLKNREYREAEKEYEAVRKTAEDTDEIDFEKLKEINPDVVAWIKIPGTDIDYPVVQGKDNEEYLHKTVNGTANSSGAIFLDCQCAGDFSSDNSIIYGHHMRNGSMFAQLLKLRDEEFLKKHNEIRLYLPDKTLRLEVFAAYAVKARTVPVTFQNKKDRTKYLKEILDKSEISGKTDIQGNIYTFVTCSYEGTDYRTYIHAAVKEEN